MSKQSGLGDSFIVGGYDLSGTVNSVDQISGGPALLDVTVVRDSAHERIGGLRDGSMAFTSFADITAPPTPAFVDGIHLLPVTDTIGMYLHGQALGNAAAAINAKQIDYDPTRGTDGSLTIKCQLQANGYGLEWGEQLTAGLRTDTTATAGTVVDDGAGTTFGAQAYLQVTALTGTDVTVKVQHCTTSGGSYTDLITFAQTTAANTVQRVAVSNATTVNEFLKVTTVTSGGFTSATFAVVFVRNPAAGVVF